MRIAERMGDAAVGHAAHGIRLHGIPARQIAAAAVARHFHVASLVGGRRIAVIDPQERADGHVRTRLHQRRQALGSRLDHLARSEIAQILVAQVGEAARLLRGHQRAFLAPEDDRRAAKAVARGEEPSIGRQDHQRAAALDLLLGERDAFDEAVLGIDERGDDGRGADDARRGGELELHPPLGVHLGHQLLDVGDQPHRHERVGAQARGHDQRLGVGIRNDAQPAIAVEFGVVRLELRPKRRVLDVMDGALEDAAVQDGHAPAVRTQVRMVIRAEKEV